MWVFERREIWLILAVLVGVACFLGGMWVQARWWEGRARRLGNRRRKQGRAAEHNAAQMLEEEGFRILEHEPRLDMSLMVNGELEHFVIVPDFLVELEGHTFVVEVKRRDSNGITNAGIRRQVVEYLTATGLPCLLVHMPAGDISEVRFAETPGIAGDGI